MEITNSIVKNCLTEYVQDRFQLLTEDQKRTIRNKITRVVSSRVPHSVDDTQMIEKLVDDIWNTYVLHPLHDGVHHRQNDEITIINQNIERLIPYVIKQKSDNESENVTYYITTNPRIRNSWENLIQAQRQNRNVTLWGNDGGDLTYWDVSKRYNDAINSAKKTKIEGKYHYSVYKVENYDTPIEGLGMTVRELGQYTGGKGSLSCVPLCYTQSLSTYNNYTKSNEYNMYALLRDGWQNEPCKMAEGYPLDSYGLSMIFVIISPTGSIVNNNVRWNHGPKGYPRSVDNIFTYKELAEIVGSDVMEQLNTTVDVEQSLRLTYEVETKLKEGQDINDIFTSKGKECCGYIPVCYMRKWNFIDSSKSLLCDEWFDGVGAFHPNGFCYVYNNHLYNFIDVNGELVWDRPFEEWFDTIDSWSFDNNGLCKVMKHYKYNWLKTDGTLLFNNQQQEWLDNAGDFYNQISYIKLHGKYNYIRTDGSIVWNYENTNDWFDDVVGKGFNNSNVAVVTIGRLSNLLKTDGTLVWNKPPELWFNHIVNNAVNKDIYQVERSYKYNFLRMDGTLVWQKPFNEWFTSIGAFYNGLAKVTTSFGETINNFLKMDGTLLFDETDDTKHFDKIGNFASGPAFVCINNKYNFIREDGTYIWDKPIGQWFDKVGEYFREGFACVSKKGVANFISTEGKLLWKKPLKDWFSGVDPFYQGIAQVQKNGKSNYIRTNGKLVWNKPFDEWFFWMGKVINSPNIFIVNDAMRYNYIKDGELLYNQPRTKWFTDISRILDKINDNISGFHVQKGYRHNFLKLDGTLINSSFVSRSELNYIIRRINRKTSNIQESLREYVTENFQLLTEDQKKTIRNKIARGIVSMTNLDVNSTEVQSLVDNVWNIYVVHPIEGEKRQNDEITVINQNIERLVPYVLKQNDSENYFISSNPRIRKSWENLIQTQRQNRQTKLWQDDDNLLYWNTNKKYNDAINAATSEEIKGKYHYSVYKIEDYNTPIEGLGMNVTELGKYTGGQGAVPLCYTQGESTYNSYTENNEFNMYAVLRDGWQNEPCQIEENYPLDSYGLSMIFVIIDENGKIEYSNVRWNHGPRNYTRSVDHIFSYNELRDIVGSNVMKQVGANVEIDTSLQLTYEVEKMLKQDLSIYQIFGDVGFFNDGLAKVYYSGLFNYIDSSGDLLTDEWFDSCTPFQNGLAVVRKGQKVNYIKTDGTYLYNTDNTDDWFTNALNFDENGSAIVAKDNKYNFILRDGTFIWKGDWFDWVGYFINDIALVKKDNKANFLRFDGTLVWNYENTNDWFDDATNFSADYHVSLVQKNGKLNYLKTDGTFVWNYLDTKKWFDGAYHFFDGLAQVKINYKYEEKWNYLKLDGTFLWKKPLKKWFDNAYRFDEGVGIIEYKGKDNWLTAKGEILCPDMWFDWVGTFHEGITKVEINGKFNFLKSNAKLLWGSYDDTTDWFDYIERIEQGYAKVRNQGRWNILRPDGKLLWDYPNPQDWFNNMGTLDKDEIIYVSKDGKSNYLNLQGKLLSQNWFDSCFVFENGVGKVQKDQRMNLIRKDGTFVWNRPLKDWFIFIGEVDDFGCAEVYTHYQGATVGNVLKIEDGTLLWKKSPKFWFRYIDVNKILPNGVKGYRVSKTTKTMMKYNFLKLDGTLLFKTFLSSHRYNLAIRTLRDNDNQIIQESLREYVKDKTLLAEADSRIKGTRNAIKRGIAAITKLDINDPIVENLTNDVWNTYVVHPIANENRQLDEYIAIRNNADRLLMYAVKQNQDGTYYITKNPRLKNGFENLIQAQRKDNTKPILDNNANLFQWYNTQKYNQALENLQANSKKIQEGQYSYKAYLINDFYDDIKGLGMTVEDLGEWTGSEEAVELCYTQSEDTYNQYTHGNKYNMYALLRQGWQDEPCEKGEGYPYDSYGLSMIFVIIDNNGDIATSNVRWNHGDNSYSNVDNMFNYAKLVQIVGSNILNKIHCTYNDDITRNMSLIVRLEKALSNIDATDVDSFCDAFNNISHQYEDLENVELYTLGSDRLITVEYEETYANIYDVKEKHFIADEWFSSISNYSCGYSTVQFLNDGTWNFIDEEGNFLNDKRYEHCYDFDNGYAVIKNNQEMYEVINIKGESLFTTDRRVRIIGEDRVAYEDLNYSLLLDMRGRKVVDTYFDSIGYWYCEGYITVSVENRVNFIDANGKYLSDVWYLDVERPFSNGCAVVKYDNGRINLINKKAQKLLKEDAIRWKTMYDYEYENVLYYIFDLNSRIKEFVKTNGQIICDALTFIDSNKLRMLKIQFLDCSWNYLKDDGTMLLPYNCYEISQFYDHDYNQDIKYAIIKIEPGKECIIDVNGNEMTEEYISMYPLTRTENYVALGVKGPDDGYKIDYQFNAIPISREEFVKMIMDN